MRCAEGRGPLPVNLQTRQYMLRYLVADTVPTCDASQYNPGTLPAVPCFCEKGAFGFHTQLAQRTQGEAGSGSRREGGGRAMRPLESRSGGTSRSTGTVLNSATGTCDMCPEGYGSITGTCTLCVCPYAVSALEQWVRWLTTDATDAGPSRVGFRWTTTP